MNEAKSDVHTILNEAVLPGLSAVINHRSQPTGQQRALYDMA